MKKFLKGLFRFLFFMFIVPVILFYSAIHIFHPEQKLLDKLNTELSDQVGAIIKAEEIHPGILGSIKMTNIEVIQVVDRTLKIDDQEIKVKKKRYFAADELLLTLAYAELIKGNAGFNLAGNAYGGEFQGSLLGKITSDPQPLEIELEWSGVKMSLLAKDHTGLQVKKGLCSGNADLIMDQSKQFKYKGPVKLTIQEADLQPPESMNTSLDLPEFEEMTGDIEFNFKEVRIHEVWLYAQDTTVFLSGIVYQRMPVKDSWIDLGVKVYLMPKGPDFKEDQYFPLTIKGSARDPKVEFLGMDLRKMQKNLRDSENQSLNNDSSL